VSHASRPRSRLRSRFFISDHLMCIPSQTPTSNYSRLLLIKPSRKEFTHQAKAIPLNQSDEVLRRVVEMQPPGCTNSNLDPSSSLTTPETTRRLPRPILKAQLSQNGTVKGLKAGGKLNRRHWAKWHGKSHWRTKLLSPLPLQK